MFEIINYIRFDNQTIKTDIVYLQEFYLYRSNGRRSNAFVGFVLWHGISIISF